MNNSAWFYRATLVLLCGWSLSAQAALSVVGTRFIYPAEEKSLTVQLGNSGVQPILAQVWVDEGDSRVDPTDLQVPFVVSAPLMRLDPERSAALQVRYTGEPLPADRESLFWINFLEVPPLPAGSGPLLRLSYRLRMKLLFRPSDLPGSSDAAARQLRWTALAEGRVSVENPSAFYVCITALRLGARARATSALVIAPFGKTAVELPKGTAGDVLEYDFVSDGGESSSARASIYQG